MKHRLGGASWLRFRQEGRKIRACPEEIYGDSREAALATRWRWHPHPACTRVSGPTVVTELRRRGPLCLDSCESVTSPQTELRRAAGCPQSFHLSHWLASTSVRRRRPMMPGAHPPARSRDAYSNTATGSNTCYRRSRRTADLSGWPPPMPADHGQVQCSPGRVAGASPIRLGQPPAAGGKEQRRGNDRAAAQASRKSSSETCLTGTVRGEERVAARMRSASHGGEC